MAEIEMTSQQGPITKAVKGIMGKYTAAFEYTGIKFPPRLAILGTIGAAFFVGLITILIDPVLSLLLVVLILDIGMGLPFFLVDKKIAQLEGSLPDVLHHMGTTLKTGGTIEVALREISEVDYGPLTFETKKMLREINEGRTFEDAFFRFADQSRSELIRRTATIIVAARRAGGGLVDTLASMSDDIREIARLKRERVSATAMPFMFLLAAGVFLAPLVFGIVKSVLEILLQSAVDEATKAQSVILLNSFDTTFKLYLVIETAFNTVGAVLIRTGQFTKSIPYLPFTMLISYVIYTAVSTTFLSLIGG